MVILSPVKPTRQELARIFPDPRMLRAVEGIFNAVPSELNNQQELIDEIYFQSISNTSSINSIRHQVSTIQSFENAITVKDVSDFGKIESNLVTPDPTKLYRMDGFVNVGSVSIVAPEMGISCAAPRGGRNISGLYSNEENHVMFVSPQGGYSGDVILNGITIYQGGDGSKIFDLNNDGNSGSLDVSNVNFGSFSAFGKTTLGELSNYRQMLMNRCAFLFLKDGLVFNGTWEGMAILDSVAIVFPALATLLAEGTTFTVGNIRSNINFISVASNSVFLDFSESNIINNGGASLTNVRSGADDAVPNLPGSSVKARYKNCDGIRNTYVGGEWVIFEAADEVETVIASANTPVKLEGVTTYSDLNHFSNTTDNAFVYDGTQTIEVECFGVLNIEGGNGDTFDVWFRKWDDALSSYTDKYKSSGTLDGSGKSSNTCIRAFASLKNNDRIEVWVQNTKDSSNLTAKAQSSVQVKERSS